MTSLNSGIHDLVVDEATIKIVSPRSELYQMAPPHLKKNYWVSIGDGDTYVASFDSLDDAARYISEVSLLSPNNR